MPAGHCHGALVGVDSSVPVLARPSGRGDLVGARGRVYTIVNVRFFWEASMSNSGVVIQGSMRFDVQEVDRFLNFLRLQLPRGESRGIVSVDHTALIRFFSTQAQPDNVVDPFI